MFDVSPGEFVLFATVALVVIGPKDLPKAMRVLGHWVGRARGVSRQFRSGFDSMVREAELAEMEKKWAEENARIMKEHGTGAEADPASAGSAHDATAAGEAGTASSDGVTSSHASDDISHPITVEKPVVAPASAGTVASADNKADS